MNELNYGKLKVLQNLRQHNIRRHLMDTPKTAYKSLLEAFKVLFPTGTKVALTSYWGSTEIQLFGCPGVGGAAHTPISTVGKIVGYNIMGVRVRFEDGMTWNIPPFCITPVRETEIEIPLKYYDGSTGYTAVINKQKGTVEVGCKVFSLDSVLAIADTIRGDKSDD